ncbi:hypothetical protein BU006_12925 [Mammaliicoccus sciuri]|uniref:hypothetical protein n=1 Tax=Mammaliicoccus sciuri TaxID=1296 RepID=UPI000BC601C7|nr:hypothetical protein [Mammaliicoccus sciuri]PCQ21041.1 hypothetical protein CP995_04090 [Klebsiella pneumoniae]MCJ0916513.1 hypothetical protein [Mammaliicoccus sciuri]MCJ0936465.1 hypothetical protein [Mammaliicoccus sciuri]PTJ55973.1 hypothetical protein BU006_12925 [Mammaliicoccus sciuri]PTJ93102.1 hypothetical protein BU010_12680 [Mammaliicoccus sciuri]
MAKTVYLYDGTPRTVISDWDYPNEPYTEIPPYEGIWQPFKHYYNGGKKTTWKWSGKATAKKGVDPIATKKKPGLNEPALPSSNNILAGQYINFFSVTKKDGYWWAEFEYPTNPKAGRFYCALGPITHKDEKLEKETKLWFDLKITSKK